jgi:hypothetical protein
MIAHVIVWHVLHNGNCARIWDGTAWKKYMQKMICAGELCLGLASALDCLVLYRNAALRTCTVLLL